MEAVKKHRINEAEDCVKRAESHLKTSILKMKFKPDYDSAATEYDRAAVCFKNAGERGRCRDAYFKAAEMHKENGNLFHSAKCNESAAVICSELGDNDSAARYMEIAADNYAQSGYGETSAVTLAKAAKFLENVDPEKTIKIYKKAIALAEHTESARLAGEFMGRITKLLLKMERYEDAADVIKEEIEKYTEIKEVRQVWQLTTALVLVQLARGDSIAAAKSMQRSFKYEGFDTSEDASVCNALISSYESGDNERFQQVLLQPLLRNMDNEYLRLMKILKTRSVEGNGNGDGDLNEKQDYDCDLK